MDGIDIGGVIPEFEDKQVTSSAYPFYFHFFPFRALPPNDQVIVHLNSVWLQLKFPLDISVSLSYPLDVGVGEFPYRAIPQR